jgi:nucleotide-binding universal stress UspA family protein
MLILVGTDGSEDAAAAAARGVSVLAPAERVVVLSVIQAPAVATQGMESGFAGGMASEETVDAAWSAATSDADQAIERTIAALPADTPAEPRVETGEPGLTICRVADELDADVIVLGTRGRGAIKRALLGSVSTHVTNNAGRPVLVIGDAADA